MDVQRIPKNQNWFSKEMLPYYIQYVNDQMIYKEDFITQLTQMLGEYKGERVMEYCSGVSGLLFQKLFPDNGQKVVCAETEEILLNAVKERAGETAKEVESYRLFKRDEPEQIVDNRFAVIYSFDYLHNCNNMKKQLDILLGKVKTGGQLWFYDLRRDAEQAMLEQVMIGYKNQKCEQTGWYLSNFISSWRASYTIDELKEVLDDYTFITYEIEKSNALTLSVKIKKEG